MFSKSYYNIQARAFQLILPMFHVKHAKMGMRDNKKVRSVSRDTPRTARNGWENMETGGMFHVKHPTKGRPVEESGDKWKTRRGFS